MLQIALSISVIIICILVAAYIIFCIVKLWRIKDGLEAFLLNLKNLDKQLQLTKSTSREGKEIAMREQNFKRICENCENTRIFVSPEPAKLFVYHCTVHNRDVEQTDTCPSFKADLLKWQIE